VSSFDQKKYRIDGEPVSAQQLIQRARDIDERFDRDWLHQTSVAATILRKNGHTVDHNPEYVNGQA